MQSKEILILLNGERVKVGSVVDLRSFLINRQEKPELLAIELNGEFIDKSRLSEITLKDGDRLDLIRYMSGG